MAKPKKTSAGTAMRAAEAAIAEARASGAEQLSLDAPAFHALTDLPKSISDLTQLTSLDLDQTGVSDLDALRGLTGLQGLWLDQTEVRDLEALRGLTGLQGLWLDGSKVVDLRPICDLAQLGEGPYGGLRFSATPAVARDQRLAALALIGDDQERTTQTLAYLKTLPPWPAPLAWLQDPVPTPPTPATSGDRTVPQPDGGKQDLQSPATTVVPKGLKRPSLSDARHILERSRPLIRSCCQFAVSAIDEALADLNARTPNEPGALEAHETVVKVLKLAKAAADDILEAVPEDLGDQPVVAVAVRKLRQAFDSALARLQQAAAYIDRKDHTPTFGGLLKLGTATAVALIFTIVPGVPVATAIPAIYACLYGPAAAKALSAILPKTGGG